MQNRIILRDFRYGWWKWQEKHLVNLLGTNNLLWLRQDYFEPVKGYFRYKTINPQNLPSAAQVHNFFYFVEMLCSVLNIFKFLSFKWSHELTYLWHHDEYSSKWDRVHFWIYLSKHTSLNRQTWPIDRYKQGLQFSWIL